MVTLAVPTLAVLQLGPCASCRAALGSVYSQGGRPAQWAPSHLPRVLELAASKAADFTAFDHVGGVQQVPALPRGYRCVKRAPPLETIPGLTQTHHTECRGRACGLCLVVFTNKAFMKYWNPPQSKWKRPSGSLNISAPSSPSRPPALTRIRLASPSSPSQRARIPPNPNGSDPLAHSTSQHPPPPPAPRPH